MNANDVIKNRTKPQAGAFQRCVSQRFAFFKFVFGEFDDQNRVLCRQANQHHQTDLRVHVIFDLDHVERKEKRKHEAPQPKHQESAEHRNGSAQQHAEGQRPAFIERRENQKNEQAAKVRRSPQAVRLPRAFFSWNDIPI